MNRAPGGVVEVAVGGQHRCDDLVEALRPGPLGKDHNDLQLGLEGQAGDLLPDQEGVVDVFPGPLPPLPGEPANAQGECCPETQQDGLPRLSALHPLVAFDGGQGGGAQDGHGNAVQPKRAGLVGVGGLRGLAEGAFEGAWPVGLGPVGPQGAQQQSRDHPLAPVQPRQGAHEGDEGVRAGVLTAAVLEGSEGHVLRPAGAERPHPRLLSGGQSQGVVLPRDLVNPSLGIAGGQLAAHRPVPQAAGHEGDAAGLARQLEGEGLRYGDGAKHALDTQDGALPGPGGRDPQQHGAVAASAAAEQHTQWVGLHGSHLLGVVLARTGDRGAIR